MTETPTSQDVQAAEPTLESVALYKHGVGAFRWQATVGSDGTLALPIPAHQIDDVLKSLLVLAADGSGVDSISYAADEPLQRQLRNFGVDLQGVTGLTDLLSRMIGATVKLRRGNESLEGQIIATETLNREARDQLVRDEWLLLLTPAGAIERIELLAVRGLEVIKGETGARLAAQLDLLRNARQPDVSRLLITATAGQQLTLSYVAEAPVWKMTYRIVLPSDTKGEPFLQGWAIAENTSAADWNGVELALISGMPLSFTLDLSHPRFRVRPVASIPEIETLAPPVSEGAMMSAPSGGSTVMMREAMVPFSQADLGLAEEEMATFSRGGAPKRTAVFAAPQAAAPPPPPTTTRSVGDLFEYHLDHPVTIPAQQAALIPVLATAVHGAAVSVYNVAVQANHPLSAVRLRNTTGLTLDAGPITVLQEGTYVGEALIDVIKPGDERLVSYAVDLGCRVESQSQTVNGFVSHVRIRQGVFGYDFRETMDTVYRMVSLTDAERTVIIEHPVRPGWDTPTPAPQETTASYHRFSVVIPPREQLQFAVRDGRTIVQSYGLRNSSAEQIAWFVSQTNNDPAVAQLLQKVIAQFNAVAERERVVNQLSNEINELTNDQNRLRSNLQALGQGREERDLARRYVDELTRSEDRLAQARNELAGARQALEQANAALGAVVDQLELDQAVNKPTA